MLKKFEQSVHVVEKLPSFAKLVSLPITSTSEVSLILPVPGEFLGCLAMVRNARNVAGLLKQVTS